MPHAYFHARLQRNRRAPRREPSSREALDRFYNHDISALPQEEQLAIAQELYDREGESTDAWYVTRFWGHLVSSSQTLISRLIGR